MTPRTKATLVIAGIAVLFLVLRLPGVDLPYHQDEWKNVATSETVAGAGTFYAHPPLMQMMFVAAHAVFGVDHFRLFPLLFSIGSAILLYFVIKDRSDRRTAAISVGLLAVCFYNILGSLSPDVDGAILPFFFLLAVFAYDRWHRAEPAQRGYWLAALIVVLLLGLLIKLNFILGIGAIAADYLWSIRKQLSFRWAGAGILGAAVFVAVYIGLLYLIQAVYPAFSISLMLDHANQYSGDAGRNWLQIIVQGAKAIYYISPLMLVPLLFSSREIFKKTLPFWLYLAIGFLFYFVVFDFSRAALDKYLMFAIVPLAAITGMILSKVFDSWSCPQARTVLREEEDARRTSERMYCCRREGAAIIIGLIIAVILIALNFLPQSVVALYPKTLWFSRVIHGYWNILTPLNGGSGPMGFYISFLFIAFSYLVAAGIALIGLFKKSWRDCALIILVIIGLAYNGVFAEEFLYGGINGNAPQVLQEAVIFIKNSEDIKQVITYNDIGAGPLSIMGKYAGRIYATPESEGGYRAKFAAFDGQYLVVDIPKLDPGGFYHKFFAQCRTLFGSDSKNVTARVYDCPHDQKTIYSL